MPNKKGLIRSKDETRYVLTGAFLDLPRQRIVGTDGCRLHYDEVACESSQTAVVPLRTVKMVTRHDCMDSVELVDNRSAFSLGGGTMASRIIEGAFPD